jgi:hypothetical protein
MPKVANIQRVKDSAYSQLKVSRERYEGLIPKYFSSDHILLRWIATMTAVEVYAIWERYAERRLTIALSNHPQHFLAVNGIRGMKSIPVGLATALVRGGGRYFDFRSTSDLIDKGDRLVGRVDNPFRNLPADLKKYLDTLGAIRNYIVHQSDSALAAYKNYLSSVYNVKSKPSPPEFLNAIDLRAGSPASGRQRLRGIIKVVEKCIDLS